MHFIREGIILTTFVLLLRTSIKPPTTNEALVRSIQDRLENVILHPFEHGHCHVLNLQIGRNDITTEKLLLYDLC